MGDVKFDEISQIISVVSVLREDKVNLGKNVKNYLGTSDGNLYISDGKEVLLTTGKSGIQAEFQGDRLRLPDEVLTMLGLEKDSLLAMIQRRKTVALKKMEIEEREGDRAQVMDFETSHKVTRVAQTNPAPGKLLTALKDQYGDIKLKYSVRDFLLKRKTLEAWKARKLNGAVEPDDEQLREELIAETDV